MWRTASNSDLHCSFCNKSQDAVSRLISSPSDRSRAYICDECVAVCHSILQDESAEVAAATEALGARPEGLAFDPALIPDLLDSIERWTHSETRGNDTSKEIDEVRRIGALMFSRRAEP
jgi:hypothetical protein